MRGGVQMDAKDNAYLEQLDKELNIEVPEGIREYKSSELAAKEDTPRKPAKTPVLYLGLFYAFTPPPDLDPEEYRRGGRMVLIGTGLLFVFIGTATVWGSIFQASFG